MGEFRNWSGFGSAMDMLGENPLPVVAIITPKVNFQSGDTLKTLSDRVAATHSVDEVRMTTAGSPVCGVDRPGW